MFPSHSSDEQPGGRGVSIAQDRHTAPTSRLWIGQLPKPVMCVPLVAQWLWLAVRYHSLTLPSALNPAIETGGLAGESKAACLAQVGAAFRGSVADWVLVGPGEDPVLRRRALGWRYPLIAKPDIGWCGYGVQRIEDDAALTAYAAGFPRRAAFILQIYAADPNEAGLFYIRNPGENAGRVSAMTFRHAPAVTGDGRSSLAELAGAHPVRQAERGRVPALGEHVALTTVASIRAGARYEDASAHISPALSAQIDAIARSMPDFHLGRFDVRFASLRRLQAGRFTIFEVNGAGAEAIHLWDPALPMHAAFRGVFEKQRMLFALGHRMRAAGHPPCGVLRLARAWLNQQRLIARYPVSN